MSQEELQKREEERINRTLNNVGRRTARPTSWSVPQTSSLNGPTGSMGRNSSAAAVKAIQEQIREEERRVQLEKQQEERRLSSPSPSPSGRVSSPSPAPSPSPSSNSVGRGTPSPSPAAQHTAPSQHYNGANQFFVDETGTEKERKMKLEEERLERWMKKGVSVEDVKADPRRRSFSIDSAGEHLSAASAAMGGTRTELMNKLQDQIYMASKALRQKKADEVWKNGFGAAVTAKSIAESLGNDQEILAVSRTLEVTASVIRASLENGSDGSEHFSGLAADLGRLFISVIGAL